MMRCALLRPYIHSFLRSFAALLPSHSPRNDVARPLTVTTDFATGLHWRWRSVTAMTLQRLFTQHPASVGETYWQHMRTAWGFAACMLLGGIACFIHGIFPFLFERTASRHIDRLHERMIVNRMAAQRTASLAKLASH